MPPLFHVPGGQPEQKNEVSSFTGFMTTGPAMKAPGAHEKPSSVGCDEGWPVGFVGLDDGCEEGTEGWLEGCPVGCPVGWPEGFPDGWLDGCLLGWQDGCPVGFCVG